MRIVEFLKKVWEINMAYKTANWNLLIEYPLEILGCICAVVLIIGLSLFIPIWLQERK